MECLGAGGGLGGRWSCCCKREALDFVSIVMVRDAVVTIVFVVASVIVGGVMRLSVFQVTGYSACMAMPNLG